MQPWEETWRITGRLANHANKLATSATGPSIGQITDDKRACLAVEAPAMARLLLKIHSDPSAIAEIPALLRRAGLPL